MKEFELEKLYNWQLLSERISQASGGAGVWGSITGTLSDQTDLQSALNSKYPSSNPAGYITSAFLAPFLTSSIAAATYYPLTNPSNYVTSAALTSYLTIASAASTYLTQANAASTYQTLANKSTDGTLSANSDTLYSSQKAVKTYIDASLVGLLNDRGNYTPSVTSPGAWPSTGGSGVGGAILKGDIWFCASNGFLGTTAVVTGASFRAIVDSPGQIASNWNILNVGLGYTPENVTNKTDDYTISSSITYSSSKALVDGLATKQNTLVSGTSIKTLEGQSLLGSGNIDLTKSDVGLSNVDNTSDLNKPISSATQTALNNKVDANGLITGATKTKITYDAKGLVTLGADLAVSDLPANTIKGSFGVGFFKGNNTVATTDTATLVMPYSGVITSWEIYECSDIPVNSSIVVEAWKDSYANYPPTIADKITASAPPTLTADIKAQGSPTGWTTAFSAGDIFKFKINSVSNAKNILLTINCQKS